MTPEWAYKQSWEWVIKTLELFYWIIWQELVGRKLKRHGYIFNPLVSNIPIMCSFGKKFPYKKKKRWLKKILLEQRIWVDRWYDPSLGYLYLENRLKTHLGHWRVKMTVDSSVWSIVVILWTHARDWLRWYLCDYRSNARFILSIHVTCIEIHNFVILLCLLPILIFTIHSTFLR